jgi:steroid 5-alpha reductase family enzyme
MPFTVLAALGGCAFVAFTCWLLSVIFREYSWVDRIWSVVPPLYVGWYAYQCGWHPRLIVLTVITALWGARLTFNYWRKGGYAPGGEDYRWAILRERMSPIAYQAFNIGFIAGYQNFLLFLIALPAWWASTSKLPFGPLDAILAALFLALLAGETIADQQQWNFHQRKMAARARGEAVAPPFLDTGLWRYSRHPNFFCEQAQWWVVYAFTLAAGQSPVNPTLIGPVLLTLLFLGSTVFTEEITTSKYPSYKDYQRRTSMLVPMPPRG